jgi:hypothetical protein
MAAARYDEVEEATELSHSADRGMTLDLSDDVLWSIVESKHSFDLLWKMLPKCGSRLRSLAEGAGFGFLWCIPHNYRPNRIMAALLLSCIDTENLALSLGHGNSVCVRASDVAEVLGVPVGGSQLIIPNPVQPESESRTSC